MMNPTEQLLYEDLVFMNYEAENKEELLGNLSEILRKKGYVKESYLEGILKREALYPTGLNTNGVKVAIPHTDAIHVEKSAIVIAILKKPVIFKEMANELKDVHAELVFMLAIKNPKDQVPTLSKLMSILSNKERLLSIRNCKTSKEVVDILAQVMS